MITNKRYYIVRNAPAKDLAPEYYKNHQQFTASIEHAYPFITEQAALEVILYPGVEYIEEYTVKGDQLEHTNTFYAE